jgi:hypothetical protein
MAEKKLNPALLRQRWIHSFEEDSAGAQVYRPQSWDFPLARRPRGGFELRADGTAQLFLPGSGDRPEAADASWTEEDGDVVVRATKKTAGGLSALRIIESTADKLVVLRS